MRRPAILFALIGAALAFACNDDQIVKPREDAGIGNPDGSEPDALALQPGMTFTYRAILTYRENATETNSQYTMTLRIESVDDQRANGPSSLMFAVTELTQNVDDWVDVHDYDTWVGRLGPSLNTDRPSMDPVTADLSEPPQIPPAPTASSPKRVPSGGTFFLDMRAIDSIRTGWAAMHPNQNPQAVGPDMNAGNWRLSFGGPDESIFYYPKTRTIALNYNPIGYLVRLEETIGDPGVTKSANCRIELTSGP